MLSLVGRLRVCHTDARPRIPCNEKLLRTGEDNSHENENSSSFSAVHTNYT